MDCPLLFRRCVLRASIGEKTAEQLEHERADLLKQFGFIKYEAHTFVRLLRIGTGTARDVAAVGDVPRSRAHDAVDTLHEASLIDVQQGSSKRFAPVSRETALHKFETQRKNTITKPSELFDQLDPASWGAEEFGVWTVSSSEAIAGRLVQLIDDAEDELVYMTVDELLTDDHLESLTAAEERGVDLYLAGVSESVQSTVRDHVPSTTVFETAWSWTDEGAGSLLVTDERTALVSVLVDRDATEGPGETAIWGTGEHNSLVVMLRAIFTWRLDTLSSGSGA